MLLVDETRDPGIKRFIGRGIPAVAVAIGVNLVILTALAAMNKFDPPQREEITAVQLVAIAPRVKQPEPPQPPEPDEPAPPEVVEVDLTLPADTPPPPAPLQIDLPLTIPTISAINIAVTPGVEQPAPSPSPAAVAEPAPAPARQAAPVRSPQPQQLSSLPRELSCPPPAYPRNLQRRGIEGTVDMMLLIDERGRVETVEFFSGEPAFQRAIEDVVYSWRFEPSTIDGVPVKVRARKTMTFALQGQ
jgi:protein TonB